MTGWVLKHVLGIILDHKRLSNVPLVASPDFLGLKNFCRGQIWWPSQGNKKVSRNCVNVNQKMAATLASFGHGRPKVGYGQPWLAALTRVGWPRFAMASHGELALVASFLGYSPRLSPCLGPQCFIIFGQAPWVKIRGPMGPIVGPIQLRMFAVGSTVDRFDACPLT